MIIIGTIYISISKLIIKVAYVHCMKSQLILSRKQTSSGRVSLFSVSQRMSVFQKSLPSTHTSSCSHARVCMMSPVRENRCPFKLKRRSFPLFVFLVFFRFVEKTRCKHFSSFSSNRLLGER